ncbi:uncharacterized protein LOC135391136 [Ornithodoros turicata]|uniref:uncharacterized protein LOC135391136 n=1 Tax=Ornithodoros turicata TaxID=34597 RepID=UPI003139624C
MNSARDSILRSDDEEDLVFDQTGLLTNKVSSRRRGLSRTFIVNSGGRITVARTVNLCLSFIGLGLCFAIPAATLEDLKHSTNTDSSSIEHIFTARYGGYILGCLIGGFLFDCYNRQFLLFLSLLATSVGIIVMPFCTELATLMVCTAVTGLTMGFLDTGGNVWCLDMWGRQSAPIMQALHFCFGLGALVAPLVAEPFLSSGSPPGSFLSDNASHPFYVSRAHPVGLHRPVGLDHIASFSNITHLISTPPGNETRRYKREEANDTAFDFNVTALQEDAENNNTLSQSSTILSRNESEVLATPTVATLANVTALKKPTKPKYTEVEHQKGKWDRESKKQSVQTSTVSPKKHAAGDNASSTAKNLTLTLQPNGTVPSSTANATQTTLPPNIKATSKSPVHTSPAANTTSLKVVNSSQLSPPSSPSPSLAKVPGTSEVEGEAEATVPSITFSSTPSAPTSPVSTLENIEPHVTLQWEVVTRTEETIETLKSVAPQTDFPIFYMTMSSPTALPSSQSTTPAQQVQTLSVYHTTHQEQKISTAGRAATSPPHSTQLPAGNPAFTVIHHIPPTKVTEWLSSPSTPPVNLTAPVNVTEDPADTGQRLWFAHYQLGQFEIAYVILGVYLFLVAAVFLAFLCANPRESKSRQDEDLIKSRRPGSHKGLVLLTALFFFFYMAMVADIEELLQGLSMGSMPTGFPREYFLNYIFWGSFAVARGLSIAVATKLSCRWMLLGDLSICLLASVLLVTTADKMGPLLWSGVGILGFGMASILPSTLVWLERHIRVTNRTASVLLLSAAFGEMILSVLASRLAQHEPAVLMYVNVSVAILCCLNFGSLWYAASKRGEKYACEPDRSLYQLASFDDDDVVELNGSQPLWGNGVGGSFALKRKTNGVV